MSSNTTTDGNMPTETKISSTFKSSTFKITINFTIDNFSFYLEDDPTEFRAIKSCEYPIPGHADVRLCLCLYPNNEFKEDSDHLSLYLYCLSANYPSPVRAKYKMSFVDNDDQDRHSRNFQYKFTNQNGYGAPYMLARSVLLDPANGLLPNDQLTIRCEATICVILKAHLSLSISDEYDKQFSVNMISLLGNAKHSDVILSVDGMQFPAHKGILSARSPVFDAMFSHQDTKEAQEGRVKIDDVPNDTFKDLLQFIYTGKYPAKERLTTELLVASDKYQVQGLKSACESHLSTSLSIESAATTLIYADMHNAASLKVNCLKYIAGNIFAVMSTEAWINMAKVRPELMLKFSNFKITQKGSK